MALTPTTRTATTIEEQNLISVQQDDQVYFRAIKVKICLLGLNPGRNRGQKRKMEEEAKEEKNTSHYSCKYCFKGSPSISSMKNMSNFTMDTALAVNTVVTFIMNVSGLKKHIRIAHPEVHKTNLKILAKDGVLRKPNKKDVDKTSKASKIKEIKDIDKDPTEMMEADKEKNLRRKR
ncbi:hypothetical protein CHS0354_027284 [Potamilus streckersoni]|uniref:Uncharacterized protein n=1 Tax=Potamilus streckersoni TaxID=2493646 RepID=A0AAE0T9E2_9BIVA|nr:hypothetical protein CHS0354_027284 [Potamilus streckersoni]